jgi:sugar O-acyltransferase (sialic acid O-acetyltransferase NeuD family)
MAGVKEKLIIVGDGETAEIAHDYFTNESKFEVVGFSAEKEFKMNDTLFGLPVVPFEEVEKFFDPQTHRAFVAVSNTMLNRLRSRLLKAVKEKGFRTCSFISPKAFVAKEAEIGENCFLFEDVVVQRGVKMGSNIIAWSGTFIGHRSKIGDNCFFASHVAISGFCRVGDNCFFGVNSCVTEGRKIANDTLIGAGSVVIRDTEEGKIYVGNPAHPLSNRTVENYINGKEII